MLWVKALHIIFMVTWFAGLFYLPRLFVYHALAEDPVSIERFKVMENLPGQNWKAWTLHVPVELQKAHVSLWNVTQSDLNTSPGVPFATAVAVHYLASRLKNPGATLQQRHDLAAIIHLCGAGAGDAYARRGFRLTGGQRCGSHDPSHYLAQVNALKRHFIRLASTP